MPPEKVLKSIQTGFRRRTRPHRRCCRIRRDDRAIPPNIPEARRCSADWLVEKFGKDRAAWALLVASFLVGLPIFFEVGFRHPRPTGLEPGAGNERSLLFYGMPMAAALTITIRWCPPHPAPAAASQLLGGDLGTTILYGIAVSIPVAIFGGMFYGSWIAKRILRRSPRDRRDDQETRYRACASGWDCHPFVIGFRSR